MFSTCRFRSRRAADSSLLGDPKRHSRQASGDMAPCSLQAFVHFPLSQVFRLRVSGDVRLPTLSRWSAHDVPPPLAPTRLGYGEVSLAPPRALRQSSPSTLWRPHVHVVLPPLPSWSMRGTPLHLSLSPQHFEFLRTRQGKHHVRRRSRPSGLRTSCPVAV